MRFDASAVEALRQYNYPGNVRELQNIVERLAILHAGERIGAPEIKDILAMTNGKSSSQRNGLYEYGASLRELMKDVERRIIVEAIAANGNSKGAAAQALATERSHFYKKCRQYGIVGGES
jgi:DNA-binding NtrC family response regulator